MIEDEEKISKIVKMYLDREFFETTVIGNGKLGLEECLANNYDLIILDLMLPGMSGEDILKELRKFKNTPVLILSSKNDDNDKIHGFMNGADDYVVKPTNPNEIVFRVKAILKRNTQTPQNNEIKKDDFVIDQSKYKVTVNDQPIDLTFSEYKILLKLLENPGIVFSRKQLLQEINEEGYSSERTIDAHIKNLRKKIGENKIETVFKIGYKYHENS